MPTVPVSVPICTENPQKTGFWRRKGRDFTQINKWLRKYNSHTTIWVLHGAPIRGTFIEESTFTYLPKNDI
jgi:hypothetical protein